MGNDKSIYLWPGDKRILDGTRPVVYVGPAVFKGIFGFFFYLSVSFLLLWWNIPLLPLPSDSHTPFFHLVSMYQMWLGKLMPSFQGTSYNTYAGFIQGWEAKGEANYVAIRWVLAFIAGVYGVWLFSKNAWEPVDLTTQVRGRKLFKGKAAFNDLKAVMDRQISTSAKGLIMATRAGFDLLKPETYMNPTQIIWLSDQARRTHNLVIGGSRRGKGVKMKEIVMQIYYLHIKGKVFPLTKFFAKLKFWISTRISKILGAPQPRLTRTHNYKLFIVDTPKGEYAELFDKKDMQQIAPDEKFSVPHAISRDLLLVQDVAQFAAGLIPVSDKDPFWGTAGRGAVTGIGAFLVKEAGTDWSYNNFAYFKDMPVKELAPLLSKYYPAMNQIMSMGEGPLGSVMGQVASNLAFMNDVADIWDGYQYKVAIHQMSAALLKRRFWMEWFVGRAFPASATVTDDDGKTTEVAIPFNICTSSLIVSHICHLNKHKPKWKWVDLKAALQEPWDDQIMRAVTYAGGQLEHIDRAYMPQHLKNITPILEYAEIWDGYEGKSRFSIREWLLDENPSKKVFLLKPSGRFKSQMNGVIRSILFFMTSMINDKYFQEDKTEILPMRNLHIVCDEFQSLGNLKEFIEPALEMFASKGVTVYLSTQSFDQLKEIYGENFLNFIQGNTGNIYIMGMNSGTSAEMVSNLVGKKSISKSHTSKTMQESGTSTSINNQVHDNEMVITADEVNSMLGTKGNSIHYLYLPGNEADAYILTAPVVRKYPKLYKPEEPNWMKGIKYKPAMVDMEVVQTSIYGSGGGRTEEQEPDYIEADEPVIDAAAEIEPDDFPPEDYEAMEANIKRSERQPLYTMPADSEGMQGTVMKDLAMDLLGGSAATTVGHVVGILSDASKNVTTSKQKYLSAWKRKNNQVERNTEV